MTQGVLFDAGETLATGIDGFELRTEFIGVDEERTLLALFDTLPLAHARWHGQTARRQVHGWSARPDALRAGSAKAPLQALPPSLRGLRRRLAAWATRGDGEFAHVLVSRYTPGAPLGWHRDAPHYEHIAGVSLGAPARMRFRPWPQAVDARVLSFTLPPRSAYLIGGAARWGWQHSIAPVDALRNSITMRTLRGA
jgi:alkylated DNA repair dioxygenase AlkB